jgi:hypothetical protein
MANFRLPIGGKGEKEKGGKGERVIGALRDKPPSEFGISNMR